LDQIDFQTLGVNATKVSFLPGLPVTFPAGRNYGAATKVGKDRSPPKAASHNAFSYYDVVSTIRTAVLFVCVF
jgi:hypothetical protein